MFWRCLLALLIANTPDQWREFRNFPDINQPEPTEPCEPSRLDVALVIEEPLIVEPSRPQAEVVEPEQVSSEESDPGDLIMLEEASGSGDEEEQVEMRSGLPNYLTAISTWIVPPKRYGIRSQDIPWRTS